MSVEVAIKKSYPSFELDVDFAAGNETLAFLGASGCGKSLTMRCIAGLVTPDEGRIVINGTVFFDSDKKINLKPQERKTALLFQDYQLFPNLTVAQNIAAGLSKSLSKQEVHERVKFQLGRFNLRGYGSRYPAHLSGGQQQRVALARMLAAEPKILMLDEPFSALDSHLKAQLEEDLIELFDKFEGTVLYVSHDIDEAFRFCDRIAVVDEGNIVQLSPSAELVSHPTSLASIKVSGVKNISKARRISAHEVEALDWGFTVTTQQEVADDAAWVAVRATYLRPASASDTQNVQEFTVRFTADSRFERTAVLDPGGIRWNADKLLIQAEDLPVKGQTIKMFIPPQHLYIASK